MFYVHFHGLSSAFLAEQGITIHQLGIDGSKDVSWTQFDQPSWEATVCTALSILLQSDNYPAYIMCNMGRHHTGTVVGCLRKVQRWNLVSIFEEYRRFTGHSKSRLMNEQFIELFDTDLVSHVD